MPPFGKVARRNVRKEDMMYKAIKRALSRRLHRRPLGPAREAVAPASPAPTPPAEAKAVSLAASDPSFPGRKAEKLKRIGPLLRTDIPGQATPDYYDFLSDELRAEFNIADTANVSSNPYDPIALEVIERHKDGLVLDCGAGCRSVYYDNVVNFEICAYESTDVRGVGERLPFRDGSFDAVFSFAVLEHVKDPFQCAREIARVMKPGAELYCVVPFLQPYHGYPHHYFNMSHQGLKTLFERDLTIDRQQVILSGHPIFSLYWFVTRWADGLPPAERAQFLSMSLGDLLDSPITYLDRPFVTALPVESQFELASTTALFARKPAPAGLE
jgi:SAM-dependent methyltransferase